MSLNSLECLRRDSQHIHIPPGWFDDGNRVLNEAFDKVILAGGGEETKRDIFRADIKRELWESVIELPIADVPPILILMPARNESRMMASAFEAAIRYQLIPDELQTTVVFAENACTDNGQTSDVITSIMGAGNRNIMGFNPELLIPADVDPEVGSFARYTTISGTNTNLIHINTAPGKAHAMNVANHIATKIGASIVVVMDGNTYPTPLTIPNMIREFTLSPKVAVVSAPFKDNYNIDPELVLGVPPRTLIPSYVGVGRQLLVTGAAVAFDSAWLRSAGGVPLVVLEDLALGAKAVLSGKEVVSLSDSVTWRHATPTIDARKKQLARYVKGCLQIGALGDEYMNLIHEVVFFMRTREDRVNALTRWATENGKLDVIETIISIWDEIIADGERMFKENGNGSHFAEIVDTN